MSIYRLHSNNMPVTTNPRRLAWLHLKTASISIDFPGIPSSLCFKKAGEQSYLRNHESRECAL
jgi:hypothetical protein